MLCLDAASSTIFGLQQKLKTGPPKKIALGEPRGRKVRTLAGYAHADVSTNVFVDVFACWCQKMTSVYNAL